ncbi:lisH domain-containing protein FOPNL isoform X2 [Zootermopsis nevadensis]|uniref:LisH domain-containing protein C16orf63-like protein n=1 Tax=Zootermopsis nevadensis TaxID=136037 RepID=A0A067QVA5_ZOONE|nr:lisH domain-containing protein FOPNL isoform X2 [Zootermopsis nevadensis]KDR13005.1 LisH domain-containing protein C16orf63-like protein [Zootermopsis nevadensis]
MTRANLRLMASEDEFLNAIRENLHKSGKLSKIKAELKTEIMKVLEPESNSNSKPEIPSETLIINELIREFLTWNGYHYTTSVLVAESGMPVEPLDRTSLTRSVGVSDSTWASELPLLYSMVSTFKKLVQQP